MSTEHDDQYALSAQVADNLAQGTAQLQQYVDQLREGHDPGPVLATLTWTALRLAEHAQTYAQHVTADDDRSLTFFSLDGALFHATGEIVQLDADLPVWEHLSAAWAKSLNCEGE